MGAAERQLNRTVTAAAEWRTSIGSTASAQIPPSHPHHYSHGLCYQMLSQRRYVQEQLLQIQLKSQTAHTHTHTRTPLLEGESLVRENSLNSTHYLTLMLLVWTWVVFQRYDCQQCVRYVLIFILGTGNLIPLLIIHYHLYQCNDRSWGETTFCFRLCIQILSEMTMKLNLENEAA